ncbi:MAG: 7-cyano-7-deazaguanine synthase QueC [Betaproteobacteria bacterium]|jgi:7-cyano-7-deazaguanine synthase
MKAAIVLLSGGLDSATVLALALEQGYVCHCLSVDYGQRHRAELDAAQRVAKSLGAQSHRVVKIDLNGFGGSALTDSRIEVPIGGIEPGIPMTYVPARNTIMLSLALANAEVQKARTIFFGANAVDYSGYPDCRPEYVQAFEAMANLATRATDEGHRLSVISPIMHLSKAEIIQQGVRLGIDYSMTVSCYKASEDGLACGQCDSCRLRLAGFEGARVSDPTRYQ